MKTLKKYVALLALASLVLGPVQALAEDPSSSATTHLTIKATAGSDPISVLAKWEMKGECMNATGTNLSYFPNKDYYNHCGAVGVNEGKDDKSDTFAQFAAPDQGWGSNMKYTVCAVVRGSGGVATSVKNVVAETNYPNIPMHTSNSNVTCTAPMATGGIMNQNNAEIDSPLGGCKAMIHQTTMHALTQDDGYDLVCKYIKGDGVTYTGNNNLIKWPSTSDLYDRLCNTQNGELYKGTAFVYCANDSLTWEDPAGPYDAYVIASDDDTSTSPFKNTFNYLPTPSYDVDFQTSGMTYNDATGGVQAKVEKIKLGDKCFFGGDGKETVRNLGNVRLAFSIAQDDMDLGKQTLPSTNWNVKYNARIGDSTAQWITNGYSPIGFAGSVTAPGASDWTPLVGEKLDLSEIEEMDFSILVIEKFPDQSNHTNGYTGKMWLKATTANFGTCGGTNPQ